MQHEITKIKKNKCREINGNGKRKRKEENIYIKNRQTDPLNDTIENIE